MNREEATAAFADLEQLVIATNPASVRKAFSALVYFDRLSIEERVTTCLAELDLQLVANEPHFRAPAAHRVTMEVFYCAIYEYFEEKPAIVEFAHDEDVPRWIEANAPAIVNASIEALEDLLPEDDPNPRPTLIGFHRMIDFDDYVAEQRQVLQAAWRGIEGKIGVYLAEHGIV